MDGHVDFVAVTGQSFIDGIVHHLIDQMVQTIDPGGADIHGRSFSHRRQALKNLYAVGTILLFRFFRHKNLILDCLAEGPRPGSGKTWPGGFLR